MDLNEMLDRLRCAGWIICLIGDDAGPSWWAVRAENETEKRSVSGHGVTPLAAVSMLWTRIYAERN